MELSPRNLLIAGTSGLAAIALGYHLGAQAAKQAAQDDSEVARAAASESHAMLEQRLAGAEKELAVSQRKQEQERKGRTLAEKALRRRIQGWCNNHGNLFHAIGFAETPFPDRRGTPRQGRLAPATRGVIRMNGKLKDALEGVETYSHVWVLFVFNDNTSATKRILGPKAGQKGGSLAALVATEEEDGRASKRVRESVTTEQYWANAKAFTKVSPPSMQGGKIGVFATRSPHHPNPIGLTLVRVERVDKEAACIHVSGIDLLNGTPVLDVKPYVPSFDIMQTATAPAWQVDSFNLVLPVVYTREAEAQLRQVVSNGGARLHGGNLEDTKLALTQVLRLDIRSVWTGRGSNWEGDAAAKGTRMRDMKLLATDTVESGLEGRPAQSDNDCPAKLPAAAQHATATWEMFYCDLRLCFVTEETGVKVLSVEYADAGARDGLAPPTAASE